MKRNDLHRYLLGAIEKKIPDNIKLVEKLMEILIMEKGAIYRRLRGEVPFSFFEVVNIAEKLDIPLNSIIYAASGRIDLFEMNIIEYTAMSDLDYKQWENYVSLISSAKGDPHSELAESSKVLPLSVYGEFDALSKFFLFKYQYLFSGTENRISYNDLFFSERLNRIFKSYFTETKKFANTVHIWDYLIFQYLVTDINFFSGINMISGDDVQQIKEELFTLLDYIEQIALNGCFEETGNPVSFYISDVNFDADYSYVQFNNIYLSHVRTFNLNSVVSTTESSFAKMKTWIESLKKSSTLITHCGAVRRAEFFEKQRMIISDIKP